MAPTFRAKFCAEGQHDGGPCTVPAHSVSQRHVGPPRPSWQAMLAVAEAVIFAALHRRELLCTRSRCADMLAIVGSATVIVTGAAGPAIGRARSSPADRGALARRGAEVRSC